MLLCMPPRQREQDDEGTKVIVHVHINSQGHCPNSKQGAKICEGTKPSGEIKSCLEKGCQLVLHRDTGKLKGFLSNV